MAQFTNQAQLRYGNSVTNSNIAVGEILEVLSISKTAVKNTYHPGGTVTYIISIINSGTAPITGLTLTDDLGAYAFSTTSLTPLTYLDNTVKLYKRNVTGCTCCNRRSSACLLWINCSRKWQSDTGL